MKNPFKLFNPSESGRHKTQLQKEIKQQAWNITKLIMKRKFTLHEYSKMEILYERYFKEFPDDEKEKESRDRLAKLKSLL